MPNLEPMGRISATPQLEVGEPRSVDEDALWESADDVVEIGEPLDADLDGGAWWESSGDVIEIGEPLDADALE